MKVLHILSQIELTGAEAYAITLSEWLISQGCEVTIVSNNLHIPTRVHFITRDIHSSGWITRWKNIFFLRRWIQQHKIQIVHCHSRAAVRVGYWATRGLPVALISTVHGRQHTSFSKKLMDLYGDRIIGVCENVLRSLKEDFNMDERKMIAIGNPVCTATAPPSSPELRVNGKRKIAVIARASGPKGQRTRDLIKQTFPALLHEFPDLEIDVIGGITSNLEDEINHKVYELNHLFPSRLNLLGYMSNLKEKIPQYELVLGSGRVPIETLTRGIMSYAIGEFSCEGLITPENYEKAKVSNFGDIGAHEVETFFDYEKITADLLRILREEPLSVSKRNQLQEKSKEDFGLHTVCSEILDVYRSTYFKKLHPKHIPILMYHKIPEKEAPSKHRIFVTKDNFERHLRFFKKNNFTTLSFKDLEDFRNLKRDPATFPRKPLILTFDDGYVDNLKNAAPLLRQYDMKATIFLLADSNIHSNYWDDDSGDPAEALMTLSQRKELLHEPFEIGSHGFRHEKITTMNAIEAYRELAESKKELETQLGIDINVFAFTYGVTTPWAAKLAKKAGYTFAVNTDTGGLHLEENPYAIFRTPIFPEDKEPQLRKKTASWYRKYFFIKRGK